MLGDGPFADARAVAATPDGRVWVLDAGSGAVVVLRGDAVVARIGGTGAGDDGALDPVALDPTNGLALFVADRAGGEILHYTAEGRLAARIPVPDVAPGGPTRQPETRGRARGRPVAVAAGSDGALFVADGARRHVLRLSLEGDVERVLDGLADPVALALGADGQLWVADAGRNELAAFDAFGARTQTVPLPDVGRLISLTDAGDRLVLAAERAVLAVRGAETDVLATRRPGETIRGAVVSGGVRVLTPTRLDGGASVD